MLIRRLLIKDLVIFSFCLNISQGSPFSEAEKNIRSTKSQEILRYLNESADPCKDFYNFACGNWKVINQASAAEGHNSVLLNANKDFEHELEKILEDRNVHVTSVEEKVKDFYQSCLSRGADTDTSYQGKLREIVDEFGSMPALDGDKSQASDFDWLKTVAEIARKYGLNIIIGYSTMPNPEDNTVNSLVVGHQEFALPLALYSGNFQEVYWTTYRAKVATRLTSYFGLDSQLAEQTANEIVDFEAQLAKGAERDRYGPHEFPTKTSVRKLHNKYSPHLDIERYLQTALGSIPEDAIFERNEGYQQNLIEVLRITSKKTLANYIFYNLVQQFGTLEQPGNCVQETKRHFLNLVENMWYRQNNMRETEHAVVSLFEDLKSVFHRALLSQWYKWIMPRVRRYSVEMLHALTVNIYSYEQTNFVEEYGQLAINSSDYVTNLKSIYALNGQKKIQKLYEAPKPYYDAANMPLGPKYIRNENNIIVPLAVMQPHYFRSDLYPNAINLGQLGSLLAHAILHAFDDESRFVDKYGNDADWWDHRSSVFFNDHTQCFIEQYGNYSYGGKPWPTGTLQSENIADNGGIRLAYATYRIWYEDTFRPQNNLDQEQLPDLNYKSKRLFFIAYAQTMCADTHPTYYPYIWAREYNPPENLRVLGALSNLKEFSTVFQCHRRSAMNPAKRCKVH